MQVREREREKTLVLEERQNSRKCTCENAQRYGRVVPHPSLPAL